ncbi:MAG: phage tail protein [Proteobacteria bacterium]|nr:phage tail protein [Pseudomonadota bacterium]
MSTPFIGEIRMFAGNFAPAGWAYCNGALISISQNDALFALLGTIYGGDGVNTFALPDLQGRTPVHQGQGPGLSGYVIGERSGVETVTLISNQYPTHTHALGASSGAGTAPGPGNDVLAASASIKAYTDSPPNVGLNAAALPPSNGGSQPHENMQPSLCVSFIISLFGVFPSQN